MLINERNRLRKEARLPLLDEEIECKRQAGLDRDIAFERFFDANRERYQHLWSNRSRGWITNAGIWAMMRRRLRAQFEADRESSNGPG
jgi:hypothetical protein